MSVKEAAALLEHTGALLFERQKDWGPPEDSFERIGRLWGAILGYDVPLEPELVALLLCALKLSRASGLLERTLPPEEALRDSLADACGYAALAGTVGASSADELAEALSSFTASLQRD